jgi:hypothetical protein
MVHYSCRGALLPSDSRRTGCNREVCSMPLPCPRCASTNPDVARFCRNCGLALKLGAQGVLGAGHALHPEPLDPPADWRPVASGAHLHYAWEALGGGKPLLGTETLTLRAFNGGYDLANVALRIDCLDERGAVRVALARELTVWRRGQTVELEIASYDLPDVVCDLAVAFERAEFSKEG